MAVRELKQVAEPAGTAEISLSRRPINVGIRIEVTFEGEATDVLLWARPVGGPYRNVGPAWTVGPRTYAATIPGTVLGTWEYGAEGVVDGQKLTIARRFTA